MRPIRAIDVVWFNYPTYVAAALVVFASLLLLLTALLPDPVEVLVAIGAGMTAWWSVASVVAAAWVFDRPGYASLAWLPEAVEAHGSWLNVTAGFDATTSTLRTVLGRTNGSALDLFDPSARYDGPLLRARRARPPMGAAALPGGSLPVEGQSVDVVTMLMSAHELEDEEVRATALAEVARVLQPAGRLVIAEFLRSPIIWLVFGPGAAHFRSRAEWLRILAGAGFYVIGERGLTPFVRAFVATAPTS